MRNRLVIVGGGAAGYFTAIHAKENAPDAEVILLEKSREVLAKVAISGGGRCNVTHHCFQPAHLVKFYPRGERELRGPFHRWSPVETVDWFESRGVPLKTESDGRMFPVSNSSQSIVDALQTAASDAGVKLRRQSGVRLARFLDPGFQLDLSSGETLVCQQLCIATGGNRSSGGLQLAQQLGHTVVEPVPSLFSFHIQHPLLRELAGISVDPVEVYSSGETQSGPILITHKGVSGPAILKLSAWEARKLAHMNYRFDLHINWLPGEQVDEWLRTRRNSFGAKLITTDNHPSIPRRLWQRFCESAEIDTYTWAGLPGTNRDALSALLRKCQLPVKGKTLNKDEFVTCGGVSLREIDMKQFASKRVPGLHFAGEVLDIDGVTGGFNFQAAWTGGFHAGMAMAEAATEGNFS